MRRHFSCIDSKTGHELILSEVSYNMAGDWLMREFNPVEINTYTYSDLNTTEIYITIEKGKIPLLFIYDENRGYLLRVDYSKLSY